MSSRILKLERKLSTLFVLQKFKTLNVRTVAGITQRQRNRQTDRHRDSMTDPAQRAESAKIFSLLGRMGTRRFKTDEIFTVNIVSSIFQFSRFTYLAREEIFLLSDYIFHFVNNFKHIYIQVCA